MKYIKLFSLLLIVCFYLFLSPVKIRASTIIFQEDFSNGFDKWQQERNNMNLWSIVDGKAKATVLTGGTITEITPKDEFWPDDLRYYEYSLDYNPLVGTDRNISFGFKDINNWYELHFLNNTLLVRIFNGRIGWIESVNYRLNNGNTYHIRIILKEKHLQVYINDQKIFDEIKDDFVNFGKISLKAGTGTHYPTVVQFDNILVKTIDETPPSLPVSEFKQTDSAWANIEYDTATTWSPDTPFIKDWGCAITSLVMILQYHGITKLPDGRLLDPNTLNGWLKTQADGYVSGGLVNWFAVTRLTKQISTAYGTPKLEYSRTNSSTIEAAKTEISQQRPVILEIPGHFLVGKGIAGDDVLINDPAFTHTKLSQHTKPLLSTRKFFPSQTDLSGLIVSSNNNVSLDATKDNQAIENISYSSEFIENPEGNKTSPVLNVLEVSKLADGNYTVTARTPNHFESYTLELHVYNKEGDVTSKKVSGITDSQGKAQYLFSVVENEPIVISSPSSFDSLHENLGVLYDSRHIKARYLLIGLQKYLFLASHAPINTQPRYLETLKEIIEANNEALSPTGKQFLLQELDLISEHYDN